jgi:hypothetical protein
MQATLTASGGGAGRGVLVRDACGRLRAAAVLWVADHGARSCTVTLAAGGDGHRAAMPAEDPYAAQLLGAAVGQELASLGDTVAVRLGPVPPGSPVMDGLLAALPGALLTVEDPIPMIRRDRSTDVGDYLSAGMRRTLRKARNRLTSDGVDAHIEFTRDPMRIAGSLPELAQCSRDRDHAGGRRSPLDDPTGRALWSSRLLALMAEGDLELAALQLDGRLAAHVLGVLDGTAYRIFEGRFVGEWARYSPGRLLEAAVVQRMLDDPRYDRLDWMTSVAPESLLAANDGEPVVMLTAVLPASVGARVLPVAVGA